jgi:hypothetical protein
MYNFVFYFIYKYELKKDNSFFLARYFASFVIAIVLAIHFGFIYCLLRLILCYFWQISIARSSTQISVIDNLKYYAAIITIVIIIFKYYTKARIEKIVTKYQNLERFYTPYNIVRFFLIFLAPLIGAIILENKSVSYCTIIIMPIFIS